MGIQNKKCIKGVIHIFEEQIIWQFQKLFFENLWISPLPADHHIFWKKHPRKKCQKVDPHYFSILRGVCFLSFFLSFHSKCLQMQFSLKKPFLALFCGFRGKLQKVNPHYFSILRGVCFLHFFRKTAVSASKCNFLIKSHLFPLFE